MLARARYARRSRHRGHFDGDRPDAGLWEPGATAPVAGPWPVVEVDTAGALDVPALVASVLAAAG
jgi:hypothetical protein